MDEKTDEMVSDFSETSQKLFQALTMRSSLAWPILKKQCEIAQLHPARLEAKHLPEIVPRIAEALSRFTTVQNGESFAEQILGRTLKFPLTERGAIRPGLYTLEPMTQSRAKKTTNT